MSGKRVYSRRFMKLAKEFLEAGKRETAPCWICGQPIDYTLPPGSAPMAHELDHYYPVSKFPELQEDPANFRHSHSECNNRRGNRISYADLGEGVADWW